MKTLKTYIFTGFGFNVLLKNVLIKSVDGQDYPLLNMNQLRTDIAKSLISNKQCFTGYQLKFLRTYLKMSYDQLGEKIYIPASTLRSWENKGSEFTGFSIEQEKAFRILAINQIFDDEKNKFSVEVTLIKEFLSPEVPTALDISSEA